MWTEQNLQSCNSCQINSQREDEAIEIEPAKVFLIGSILRFDILSNLTAKRAPLLSEQYQQILQTPRYDISLESVLGCRNWLLITLLNVYSLRDWKENTKMIESLSMWELMRKAQEIKQSLESNITLNLEGMNKHKQELKDGGDGDGELRHSKYDIPVVTHIFACAVSILLEVVVSGALPKLPEIKNEMSRAIESYAYINNPDLLYVLRWPLYVAGCLAGPEHHDFFRGLLTSPNTTRFGSFQESLQLLEECWQLSTDVGINDAGSEMTAVYKFLTRGDVLIA